MTSFLLDTNILSDVIKRGSQSVVAHRIAQAGIQQVLTSAIVVAEIDYGVERKGSAALRENARRVLSGIKIMPFTEPAARRYGMLRAELERSGSLIGPNDLLIAAHCLELGCVIATNNVREFARVPSLVVEDWLTPPSRPLA